jgi:hypothetical protein
MYVVQSNACTVPNGSTPVSQRKITKGQAILGRMNTQATAAQAALDALLCRMDLNTNGWPVAELGGPPSACGTEGAVPIGGNNSGLSVYPGQLVFYPTPQGIAPTSVAAYAAPPAPPMPSLVTSGHPSYQTYGPGKSAAAARLAAAQAFTNCYRAAQQTHKTAPVRSPQLAPITSPGSQPVAAAPTAAPIPVCTQYPYGSAPYIDCVQAGEEAGDKLTGSQFAVYQGLSGTTDGTCDFLTGMVSAIALGASMLYLYDYLKKTGRINF